MPIFPVEWENGRLKIIDQTLLPERLDFIYIDDVEKLRKAICEMKIRGAPLLGIAAAFGVFLGVRNSASPDYSALAEEVERVCNYLASSRPTAVNLFWGLERMKKVLQENRDLPLPQLKERLLQEALLILEEDRKCNIRIGENGASLINDGDTILTHCNAGALATGGYGTALSIIYTARQEGKNISVYVDETRPLLQGARLTCWELLKEKIDVTLICDSMAGEVMR
ncbi:s-methyl-5-thioribose-1-phosphate isomerase, partial [Candidatus Aerophobetes bacterium]|nr:s-methyl-5-thioribose-1-phosphate isomerase [Candidatus Aerophobetes bacterium]